MLSRRLSVLIAVLAASLAVASSAQAATFTVDSTADAADASTADGLCKTAANTCTLRAAVTQANFLSGADTVTVPSGTYALPAGPLLVTGSITINGAGARSTIIDGPNSTEGIQFAAGSSTLRGVTVTSSAVGVLVNSAEVVIDQVTIRDNAPGTASGTGAGLVIFGATADVLLLRSTVSGNRQLADTSLAFGAGISLQNNAKLTAVESSITDNAVGGDTAATQATMALGGGLGISLGSAVLRHVTLARNRTQSDASAHYGGNVAVLSGPSNAITFADTLVSDGTAGAGAANCSNQVVPTVIGRNLDSGTTCGFGAGALNTANPLLLPLGAFGGGTNTSPLQVGSPAIDAASACEPGGDQRGAAKAGAACDIGATELSTDLGVTVQSSRATVAADGDVTHVFRVSNPGPDVATGVTLDVSAPGGQVTIATPTSGTCTLTVHCDLGSLPGGESVAVTVVVRAGAGGPLVTTATAGAATPDVNAANGTISASTAVTPAPDTTAPVLGSLKLSGKARTKKRITVTGTLSEAGTVAWKLERISSGRAKKVGTTSTPAAAGALKIVIPAKYPKRALKKGRYRLTVTARDAAGNTSKARTLSLKLKR